MHPFETRNSKFEIIIVGAGLAGASAALALSEKEEVLILEAEHPCAGATGVAGGLFSPMIALRGRPVWRIDEAIDAFRAQLADAGAVDLFDDRGVLRPAKDEQQVDFFEQSVARCPRHAAWLPAEAVAERFPGIRAPLGAMLATTGGAISLTAYTGRLLEAAQGRGAQLVTGARVVSWGREGEKAWVEVDSNDSALPEQRIYAHKILLAGGAMFFSHPGLQHLDLHAVKGQTVRLQTPDALRSLVIPPVSGSKYLIPEGDTVAVGSSFEHEFSHDRVDRAISDELRDGASALVPALSEARIVEEHVGIRVTVPKVRLPMVGPLPDYDDIWVFTAFGSKGLLLAPLLARELEAFEKDPTRIPSEIRVRTKSS